MKPSPDVLSRQPRILIAGYTAQSTANKTGIDRGLPFLQKPFTAAGLVKHVRDALDRRAGGSAA